MRLFKRYINKWNTGLIMKLSKKGDLEICENRSGITLLNYTAKVLAKIIHPRISTVIESTIRNEQAGFRSGKSGNDHTSTIRILIDRSIEGQSQFYLAFKDVPLRVIMNQSYGKY